MQGVAVLIPVLRRPHRVVPLLESIEKNTPTDHRALFLCTEDDEAQQQAIDAVGGEYEVLPGAWGHGDYARKINHGIRVTNEPLIFMAADDLAFHPDWLERAASRLTDGVQVVGTNDLGNARVMRGEHSTHSLLTRQYAERGTIDEPDKVLHEGYPHEFVDDEFVATAKHRGVFGFAGDSIVEHLHPLWGKAPTDELYDQHASRMRLGRRLFEGRQSLWT